MVSSPLAVKVEFCIFYMIQSAMNGIVYLFRAFKLHPSFLQSVLVKKINRCHCIFIFFSFNLANSENYVKFLSSVYFSFFFFDAKNYITP